MHLLGGTHASISGARILNEIMIGWSSPQRWLYDIQHISLEAGKTETPNIQDSRNTGLLPGVYPGPHGLMHECVVTGLTLWASRPDCLVSFVKSTLPVGKE